MGHIGQSEATVSVAQATIVDTYVEGINAERKMDAEREIESGGSLPHSLYITLGVYHPLGTYPLYVFVRLRPVQRSCGFTKPQG